MSNNKDENNNNSSMININLSDVIIYSGIIIFLWFAFQTLFEIISHNVISASAVGYDFVQCFNQVTNSTFTYPEGTECSEYEIHEFIDDGLEEDLEEQDEREHNEESEEWKK